MADSANRMLELKIPALDDSILAVELDGEDYISYPFGFTVLALSDNHDLLNKYLIGKPATITIGNHSQNPQYYNGLISSITAKKIHSDGLRTYQIIIKPWLEFLDLTQDNRIYAAQKPQTIPEIVTQVFKNYNYTDYDISKLKQKYKPLNYCVQYQESALNFVSRLLEQAGIYYYFTHTQNKHTLMLADSGWFVGNAEEAHYTDETHEQPHIFKWESSYQLVPNARTTQSYDFQKPSNLNKAQLKNSNNKLPSQKLEQFHYGDTGRDADAQKLEKSEKFIMQHNLLRSENITAESTYHQYHAGTVLKIKDNYYIYGIRHKVKDHSHRIGHGNKDNAQEYQNSFRAYPSKQPFVPHARHKKPAIEDIQTATVVGPKGKDIYTDKYGRIKIQFHWDRYGNQDENSSCWIRLKQLWSGDKYGSSFIPRINQEVLVSHEHGDPDLPLVTSIVPNNNNMLPFTPDQTPTQSGFRSVKGNELRFEDKTGQEEIYIKAPKDLNTKIDGSSQQTIGEDSNLNILQGDYLNTINGNLTIESAQKIALACGTSEIIITDPDITVQADKINLQQGKINIPENPGTTMQDLIAKLNTPTAKKNAKSDNLKSEPDKIIYPSAKFNLSSEFQSINLPDLVTANGIFSCILSLKGDITLKSKDGYDAITFNKNKDGFTADAKDGLSNIFADVKIMTKKHGDNLDLASLKSVGIGDSIVGYYWTTNIKPMLTPTFSGSQLSGLIANLEPNEQNAVKCTYQNWIVSGLLGFILKIEKQNPQSPLRKYATAAEKNMLPVFDNILIGSILVSIIKSLSPEVIEVIAEASPLLLTI